MPWLLVASVCSWPLSRLLAPAGYCSLLPAAGSSLLVAACCWLLAAGCWWLWPWPKPRCDKGDLYAIRPRGLRGSPIKIGYSLDILRRMAEWEYSYPEGIEILAVARMNRPNTTHTHKRRALQLAESLLKRELQEHVVAREEWLRPSAKAATLAAMRRLQRSLSPNLAGHFFAGSGTRGYPRGQRHHAASKPATTRRQRHEPAPALWPCHLRHKGVEPKCEADALCYWQRSPHGHGKCVAVDVPAHVQPKSTNP